jgi:hypothetical protein
MKKTFRRRASRSRASRKRTYGGRKLRKMRGGFTFTKDSNNVFDINFTEAEVERIQRYNGTKTTAESIYNNMFRKQVEQGDDWDRGLKANLIEEIKKYYDRAT